MEGAETTKAIHKICISILWFQGETLSTWVFHPLSQVQQWAVITMQTYVSHINRWISIINKIKRNISFLPLISHLFNISKSTGPVPKNKRKITSLTSCKSWFSLMPYKDTHKIELSLARALHHTSLTWTKVAFLWQKLPQPVKLLLWDIFKCKQKMSKNKYQRCEDLYLSTQMGTNLN